MATDDTAEPFLAEESGYRFPVNLIGPENEGPAFDAFRAVTKINSANHFNEEAEGRPALERVAEGFFKVAHLALASMKPDAPGK